jgi:hypothetical protein
MVALILSTVPPVPFSVAQTSFGSIAFVRCPYGVCSVGTGLEALYNAVIHRVTKLSGLGSMNHSVQ